MHASSGCGIRTVYDPPPYLYCSPTPLLPNFWPKVSWCHLFLCATTTEEVVFFFLEEIKSLVVGGEIGTKAHFDWTLLYLSC